MKSFLGNFFRHLVFFLVTLDGDQNHALDPLCYMHACKGSFTRWRKCDIFALGWAIMSLNNFILFLQLASLMRKHCILVVVKTSLKWNNAKAPIQPVQEDDDSWIINTWTGNQKLPDFQHRAAKLTPICSKDCHDWEVNLQVKCVTPDQHRTRWRNKVFQWPILQ